MLNDPDVRNVGENTMGDFLAFELFDGKEWANVHISLSALVMLGAPENLNPIESFERNIDRIKGVAFGIGNVGNGRIDLGPGDFKP